MAPRVSKEYKKTRREQIVEAAAECFARKGFHQTTMKDICKAASMSPGAVYRYFKGKEEIIKALAEAKLRHNLSLLAPAKERQDTFNALQELADVFFAMLEEPDKNLVRLDIELYAEALRNKKILKVVRRNLDEHMAVLLDIVKTAQSRGNIADDLDPEALARVMISFFDGLALQRGIDPDADIWSYVSVIKTIMQRAIFTQGAPQEGE